MEREGKGRGRERASVRGRGRDAGGGREREGKRKLEEKVDSTRAGERKYYLSHFYLVGKTEERGTGSTLSHL